MNRPCPSTGFQAWFERVAERCVHTGQVEERDGGRDGALRVHRPVRVAIAHERRPSRRAPLQTG